jgi:hypothetical protein
MAEKLKPGSDVCSQRKWDNVWSSKTADTLNAMPLLPGGSIIILSSC